MISSDTFRRSVILLAVSAFSYALLHFAFDLGDFLLFTGSIGPKNFLPLTMGMILGPFGTAGVLAGALASGVISGAGSYELIAEATSAAVMSGGGWLLWYAGKSGRAIALKNMRDLLRFTLISLALSGVGGFIAFLAGSSYWMTFGSYMAWNLLLGIPVVMIMTSIFCVKSVYPPWRPLKLDINERFILAPGCIAEIGDIIDELCFAKKLERKRGFQMQSCIEECILLILSEPTCLNLLLTARINDSISITMQYNGKPCNPLRGRTHEDQIGLTLIKQRALRARHHYRGGENHLHIVQ